MQSKLFAMQTYPINSYGGLFAFEISNLFVGPRKIATLLSKNPSVKILRVAHFFESKSDDRVVFEFEGIEFVVNEPFSNNSRYWIGPRDTSMLNSKIEDIQTIFLNYDLNIWRCIMGALVR